MNGIWKVSDYFFLCNRIMWTRVCKTVHCVRFSIDLCFVANINFAILWKHVVYTFVCFFIYAFMFCWPTHHHTWKEFLEHDFIFSALFSNCSKTNRNRFLLKASTNWKKNHRICFRRTHGRVKVPTNCDFYIIPILSASDFNKYIHFLVWIFPFWLW